MKLVAKLTIRDCEKLLEYAQQVEALMARHGGGLLGASSPAVRALEGDWRPDVLVLQRWRSRDDFAVADVPWTYISPAAVVEPGARTGRYRRGGDHLLVDENGESRISIEDYAVAVHEAEQGAAPARRMTVAY